MATVEGQKRERQRGAADMGQRRGRAANKAAGKGRIRQRAGGNKMKQRRRAGGRKAWRMHRAGGRKAWRMHRAGRARRTGSKVKQRRRGRENGGTNGIFNLGVAAYTIAIVVVNLKIVTSTNSFTILSILVVWVVSILSYFIFIPVISLMGMTIGSFNDLSDVGFKMYVSTSFWLVLFLGVVTAFLPDWTFAKLQSQCTPEDFQVCQEIEHGWRDGAYSKNSGYVGPLTKRSSQSSQERDFPENSMSELVPFPTKKVRPSHSDSEELPSRRRMTWREVLSEVDLEAISRGEMEHGWARRVSNGFEIVTRHSDVTTIPKPLEEGPLPLLRVRTV